MTKKQTVISFDELVQQICKSINEATKKEWFMYAFDFDGGEEQIFLSCRLKLKK